MMDHNLQYITLNAFIALRDRGTVVGWRLSQPVPGAELAHNLVSPRRRGYMRRTALDEAPG
jgi:hypothetical protein